MKQFGIVLAFLLVFCACAAKTPPFIETPEESIREESGYMDASVWEKNSDEYDWESSWIEYEEFSSVLDEVSSQPETAKQPKPAIDGEETIPAADSPSEAARLDDSPAVADPAPGIVERNTRQEQGKSPYLGKVEREIISLINQKRAALGLRELEIDADLTEASRIRSREMYQNKYFAHGRPNGDAWQTVLQQDVPVAYVVAGENLAQVEHNLADYDPAYDAQYWYTTWENSPSHYDNIKRTDFTHIGAGVFYAEKDGMIYSYATTIFASF